MKGLLLHVQQFGARLRRIFWIRLLADAYVRFNRDNGWLLSAGLSFYMILAFVPLLLVGLWGMGHFYAHDPDAALHQIQNNIVPQFVPGGGAGSEVDHLLIRARIAAPPNGQHAGVALIKIMHGHGIAGLLALLTTIWAAIQIFVNGSVAMNAAWETHEKRNWFMLRLVALSLLIFSGALLAVSLGLTALSTHLAAARFTDNVPFKAIFFSILAEITALVVSGIMYAAVYKFLPVARVSWKAALAGGIFASVTWEIAKKALSVFLLRPNQNLYGDLGNLIVFVLWILYSMVILLIGAEISAVYSREVENAAAQRLRQTAIPHTSPHHEHAPRQRRRRTSRPGGGPHARR